MLELCCEISSNHLGDYYRAVRLIEAAAEAGADLCKFQVWEPDTMVYDQDATLASGPWAGRKLVDLYREAFTPWAWLPDLFAHARRLGLEPFGAAFDVASVEYLEKLGVHRHKVASFEATDKPLIRRMLATGKLVYVSTGIVDMLPSPHVVPLACASEYPAKPQDVSLAGWSALPEWGLSDHSRGVGVACAAAALGASYIEKHLTLARADGGLDSGFSLEPDEFATLVTECRAAHAAATSRTRKVSESHAHLARSLWVVQDVQAGEALELGRNVRSARLNYGAACDSRLTCAAHDLKSGQPLVLADMT